MWLASVFSVRICGTQIAILASTWDFGTYRIVECWGSGEPAQTRQSLHSSKIWHSHCQHEILVPLLHCRVTNDSILEPWRICTFTQVHASLRQRTKISYTFMRASSPELSLLDNAISNKNLTCWLKWRFGGHYDSVRVAKTLTSLHIWKGSPEPSSQDLNLMCWPTLRFVPRLSEQRRLWRVCTNNHNKCVQP